jgi:hypothetical protein
MKMFYVLLKAALLTMFCLSLAACSTPEATASKPRRFHEASRADAVLQFSSWEYIFIVQPRYAQNGFLRQVRRESISRALDECHVRRSLAVVVIGWQYESQETNRLLADWKSIMGGCGFQRVVFLRSNTYNQLNGSQIIDDSTLSLASAPAASSFQQTGR